MKNVSYYKEKLEKEFEALKLVLSKLGFQDPDNPSNWQAKEGEQSLNEQDPTELADEFEEYFENVATTERLEDRYNEVQAALKRIEDGTYGKDESTGEQISEARLDADPAARTEKPE